MSPHLPPSPATKPITKYLSPDKPPPKPPVGQKTPVLGKKGSGGELTTESVDTSKALVRKGNVLPKPAHNKLGSTNTPVRPSVKLMSAPSPSDISSSANGSGHGEGEGEGEDDERGRKDSGVFEF